MNTYCVYKHTSPSNKVYIGITYHTNPAIRWGPGGCGYAYNQHFWNAIRKYGWDNFKHEIVRQNLTRKQALAVESDLIHEYQATNPNFGYNKITGGTYMGETNPEYRQQLSERVKNQIWVHARIDHSLFLSSRRVIFVFSVPLLYIPIVLLLGKLLVSCICFTCYL